MEIDHANLDYRDESTHGIKVVPGLYRFAVAES
jgi:hypothetical protein